MKDKSNYLCMKITAQKFDEYLCDDIKNSKIHVLKKGLSI